MKVVSQDEMEKLFRQLQHGDEKHQRWLWEQLMVWSNQFIPFVVKVPDETELDESAGEPNHLFQRIHPFRSDGTSIYNIDLSQNNYTAFLSVLDVYSRKKLLRDCVNYCAKEDLEKTCQDITEALSTYIPVGNIVSIVQSSDEKGHVRGK